MARAVVSILLSVLLMAIVAAGAAAEQRPFTVNDLVAMARIADPQPSPDGSRVAFTVTTMDLDANKGRSDLWVAALDGSWSRRLTTHEAADSSALWAGDQALYFLSSRSGSSQVWRLSTSGGEAQQVTRLPLDVEAFQVGPKGDALYVAMAVFPDCAEPVPCTVERVAAEEARKSSGRVYDRLFVRHWDSWEDGRRNHVFRIPVGPDGLVAGRHRYQRHDRHHSRGDLRRDDQRVPQDQEPPALRALGHRRGVLRWAGEERWLGRRGTRSLRKMRGAGAERVPRVAWPPGRDDPAVPRGHARRTRRRSRSRTIGSRHVSHQVPRTSRHAARTARRARACHCGGRARRVVETGTDPRRWPQ